MCEELEVSQHAHYRMEQRGVAKEYIRQAFRVGKIITPGTKEGTLKLYATLRNRRICVVFKKLGRESKCLLISVWWAGEVN